MYGSQQQKLPLPCQIIYFVLLSIVGVVGLVLTIIPLYVLIGSKQANFFFILILVVGVALLVFFGTGFLTLCFQTSVFARFVCTLF